MGGETDRRMKERANGWINGQTDEWMDGWMGDGWMVGLMKGR